MVGSVSSPIYPIDNHLCPFFIAHLTKWPPGPRPTTTNTNSSRVDTEKPIRRDLVERRLKPEKKHWKV